MTPLPAARPTRSPARSRGARAALKWAGAALFVLSLSYFLFSYAVTFGEIADVPFQPGALATNLALFSVFAVHHSVCARSGVRRWIANRAGDLERSVYVSVASLMLVTVCAAWQRLPGVLWVASAPWSWALTAVQIAAVALILRSASVLDVWELAGLRPARLQRDLPRATSQPPPSATAPSTDAPVENWEFKTEGPYGWVRHPIYLGWFLLVFAVGTMTTTRFAFAAISCAYVVAAIPLEERTLLRQSHRSYAAYMRAVRWRLVPWVY